MTNIMYRRGRAKEYRIMKKLREEGYQIVARSAGSHSPIDIWAIFFGESYYGDEIQKGVIRLIQSKGGKSGKRERKKALEDIKKLEGLYWVRVEVL